MVIRKKKARWLFFVLLSFLYSPVPALSECDGDCPENYYSVCIEVDGNCYCDCAKDAENAGEKLSDFLKKYEISEDVSQEAVERYLELAKKTEEGQFNFEVKNKTKGPMIVVWGSAGKSPEAE